MEAILQLGLTFAWVHFTADTSFITLASLVFSALTITSGIMDLLVRAIIKARNARQSLIYELSKAALKTQRSTKKLSKKKFLKKIFPRKTLSGQSEQSVDQPPGDDTVVSEKNQGPVSKIVGIDVLFSR